MIATTENLSEALAATDLPMEQRKNQEIRNESDFANFQRSDAPLLGKLIWWRHEGKMVDLLTLKNAVIETGLPSSYLPKEISGDRAFKRAMDKVVKESRQKGEGSKFTGLVVTKVIDDASRIKYTIHERAIDKENEQVDIAHADTVEYQKETNVLSYSERYAEQIQEWLGVCKTHFTTEDVRIMVTKIVNDFMQCLTLKARGGLYFVPASKLPYVSRLEEFIKKTTGGMVFNFPVFTPEREQMSFLAKEELESDIQKLVEEANEALADTSGNTKFTNRIAKLDDLKDKIQVYAMLFEFHSKELFAMVDGAKQNINDLMKNRYTF